MKPQSLLMLWLMPIYLYALLMNITSVSKTFNYITGFLKVKMNSYITNFASQE